MENETVCMLKSMKAFLDNLYLEGLQEGRELFPDHPIAQDVWARLCSSYGGIEPVVETLGLHDAFAEYQKDFLANFDTMSGDLLSLKIQGFVDYCKSELKENFYMFK